MKEKTVFVYLLALGVSIMMGCGGSGGDDVPRSSAAYAGSSLPAVLDSTSNTRVLGENFLGYIGPMSGPIARVTSLGTTKSNTSDYFEGGDGGSFTYAGSYSITWSDTLLDESLVQSLSFSDFVDSSGVSIYYVEGSGIPNNNGTAAMSLAVAPQPLLSSIYALRYDELQAGRGSLYRSFRRTITSDGIPTNGLPLPDFTVIGPDIFGLVGTPLTDATVFYSNYNSFFTSQGHDYNSYDALQRKSLQTGFTSSNMSGTYNSTVDATAFDDTLSADYAMDYFESYTSDSPETHLYDYTTALLDFTQRHAWDLSTATLVSSGTYCAEGELQSPVMGCLDFDFSLTWDNDASGPHYLCRGYSNPLFCYGQPDDGLTTFQADGTTASFAYTPGGTTFTLDAGDGSDPFETNLPPIPPMVFNDI